MGAGVSRNAAVQASQLSTVPFDQFVQLVASSQVSSVTFQPDDVLEFATTAAQHATTRIIRGLSTEWLVQRLIDSRTPFSEGRKLPSPWMKSLRGTLVLLVPMLYLWLAYMMMKRLTEDSNSSIVEERKKRRTRSSNAAPITWEHVAGMDDARLELQEVVDYLRRPERYRRLGASCPKGVLLSGPPGTGKTLLARATAHEAGVNIIVCSASDFVEVFVGRGAARVRDLFQRAERCAPCILFFDELDALAKSRTGGGLGNDEREQTLNQLLTEMDGFDGSVWGGGGTDGVTSGNSAEEVTPASSTKSAKSGGPVIVIAATNRPDVLDSALLRPGRFDRHVRVQLPEEDGRLAILLVHVEQRQVPLAPGASLAVIARDTPGFSGAELSNVVNEAALLAVRAGSDAVEQAHLDAARAKVSEARPPLLGPHHFFSPMG